MLPAFDIFGRTVSAYQIFAIIGILTAGIWACRTAAHRGLDDNDMIIVLLVAGGGVILGGHLLYGVTQIPYFRLFSAVRSVREFFLAIYILFGGSVFYGGLLGGTLAALLTIRAKRLPRGTYFDILTCAAPLFHAFGRVGCFLGGCCYGIESSFGFLYQHAIVESANGVRRFPVQLLEAAINLLLFLLLSRLLKRKKFEGHLACIYLLLYPVCRFFLEFLRGDAYRGFLLGLSTSQWISIILFAGAILWLTARRFRPKTS